MPRFPYIPNMPFSYYNNYPKYQAYPGGFIPKQDYGYNNNQDNLNKKNISNENKSNSNNDDYMFDLFGLKLYYDDILILSLLFFLYTQGVKDEGLFIVLLLLLLT